MFLSFLLANEFTHSLITLSIQIDILNNFLNDIVILTLHSNLALSGFNKNFTLALATLILNISYLYI